MAILYSYYGHSDNVLSVLICGAGNRTSARGSQLSIATPPTSDGIRLSRRWQTALGDMHRCTHEGTAGAHAGRQRSEHDERVRPGDASQQALFFDGKSRPPWPTEQQGHDATPSQSSFMLMGVLEVRRSALEPRD